MPHAPVFFDVSVRRVRMFAAFSGAGFSKCIPMRDRLTL